MRVGFELEVAENAGNVLHELRESGLTEHDGLHGYHCNCSECSVSTSGPLFKAQEDCTADGEFITRILEYGSPDMERAITGIERALLTGAAIVNGDVGNHVHVERAAFDGDAEGRLARLFVRYQRDLFELASGRFAQVRDYNGVAEFGPLGWESPLIRTRRHLVGTCLAFKPYTIEFRLWNSTRAGWRIRMHVGLSVALAQAALAGENASGPDDPRCLEEVISPYMDRATWAGVLRQRYAKGGMAIAA